MKHEELQQRAEDYADAYFCDGISATIVTNMREAFIEGHIDGSIAERIRCKNIVHETMLNWGQGIAEKVNMGDATLEEVRMEILMHDKLMKRLLKALE